MKPTDHGDLNDVTVFRRFNWPRIRRVFPESQMRTRIVIVGEVPPDNPAQMSLVEHQHVVEAVSA